MSGISVEVIDKLRSFNDVERVIVDERTYTNRQLVPVKTPLVEALKVNTLTGLVDYIVDCVDRQTFNLDLAMIHIVDHGKVALRSHIVGDFREREMPVLATALLNDPFPFDRYLELEDFIIKLQAHFVRTETVDQILRFVSSVDSENQVNQADDGVTQVATIKQGVALRAAAAVPNPVELQPYRSFLEIVQPASRYVFRIKNQQGVKCALFEAGGGEWKLEAIKRIKAWLEDQRFGEKGQLPVGLKILA